MLCLTVQWYHARLWWVVFKGNQTESHKFPLKTTHPHSHSVYFTLFECLPLSRGGPTKQTFTNPLSNPHWNDKTPYPGCSIAHVLEALSNTISLIGPKPECENTCMRYLMSVFVGPPIGTLQLLALTLLGSSGNFQVPC